MKIRIILLALFLGLSAHLAAADTTDIIDKTKLLKVTPETVKKCITYYSINNQSYCSTKPVSTPLKEPKYAEFESMKVKFDDRPWHAAWGKQDARVATVEYITAKDNINDWHELVTTQFFHTIPKNFTANDYLDNIINNLTKGGYGPKITILDQKNNDITFEFQLKEPATMQQDEIQRIFITANGLYIIHYVNKKDDMGDKMRKKWTAILKQATPK